MILSDAITDTLALIGAADHDPATLNASVDALAGRIRDEIPSCVDVGVLVSRDGSHATARASLLSAHQESDFASSLLITSAGRPRVCLLLRGVAKDAFAGLAADLDAGPDTSPPLLDRHRQAPAAPADAALSPFTDLAFRNQAVGALLDHGWLPDEAAAELNRLAGALAVPPQVAARLVLVQVVDRQHR